MNPTDSRIFVEFSTGSFVCQMGSLHCLPAAACLAGVRAISSHFEQSPIPNRCVHDAVKTHAVGPVAARLSHYQPRLLSLA